MQNHYPLWKNILLIVVLVIAIIYALPNLFGSDQAVQISSTGTALVTDDTLTQTQKALTAANIKYISSEKQQGDKLLIRFADTDIQLKACDVIKTTLGEDYVVALNLASRTPKWLQFLGANPMKLGLDLCGGVHFLLEVDLNDMIKKREDGDIRSITNDLREANIRYLTISHIQPHGVSISFRDTDNLDKGSAVLSRHFQDYLLTKITTNGEAKLQVVMAESAVFKVADYAIEQTMNILRNRVNELGVSEAIVQRQGKDRVSVDLPGIQDTARAKEIIGKTASLKFLMVDTGHDAEAAMAGDMPLGSKIYDYDGRPILLKDQVILQGNSITYATTSFSQDGRPAVNVRLGGGGESVFHRVTAESIGKAMAVVYVESKSVQQMVNGKPVTINRPVERVISVATIQSALGNNFEITGLRSEKYAQDLSLLLRSGALVAPTHTVQERTVGPSMGKDNINKGIYSIVVGYLFVLLFMVFYYRLFGLIANIALLLNLVFVMAILSILDATLTLAGMAGMVLTVGMAVDSNVLIYERIREELRNGASPQASIYAGYERAFTTIVDANVATLIVAIVLFAVGTGAVKGFAVVLTIGLMTSMLTAIVFTRAIVNLIYGGRGSKKLSIGV
jgi:preprotein translocase subunit SecD